MKYSGGSGAFAGMMRVVVAGVATVVLLAEPSIAWAQAGPNLVIAMSHTGNFTVGVRGVYTIVVSNIGGAASSGMIAVGTGFFPSNPNFEQFASATGNGWSCSVDYGLPNPFFSVSCSSISVIPAGGSAPPITLTEIPKVIGTLPNSARVVYPCLSGTCENTASDPTIVVAAVPTLPQWAMIALTVLLAFAGFKAMRRRTT